MRDLEIELCEDMGQLLLVRDGYVYSCMEREHKHLSHKESFDCFWSDEKHRYGLAFRSTAALLKIPPTKSN